MVERSPGFEKRSCGLFTTGPLFPESYFYFLLKVNSRVRRNRSFRGNFRISGPSVSLRTLDFSDLSMENKLKRQVVTKEINHECVILYSVVIVIVIDGQS